MEPSALAMLRTIYRHQPVTRQELRELTGLGANRVSTLVSRLKRQRYVCEEPSHNTGPGRPATLLSPDPALAHVAGLDIGGTYSRAVLSGANGRLLASCIRPTQTVPDRAIILDNIVHLIEDICREGGTQPQRLAALGVGVRAIVNTPTGVVLNWPNTPAWASAWMLVDVPSELGARLPIAQIVVDDSVRTMGLAAHRFGAARDKANFVYVFLGSGIGAAVFVNGEPYVGTSGMAGEVGHVAIDANGPWCTCGNRGCLEALASTSAVMRRARERLAESGLMSTLRDAYENDALTLPALIEAARAGDKLAFQILDETGTYVGKVLALALNLLDPELVVLGGPLVQDGDVILEAVRYQVRLQALPHISKQTEIVVDDQGELAGARGAALLALDRLFDSEEHLQRLLA